MVNDETLRVKYRIEGREFPTGSSLRNKTVTNRSLWRLIRYSWGNDRGGGTGGILQL